MPIIRTRDEWEQALARGRRKFLIQNGVLQRGLPLGIALAVVLELYLGGTFPDFLRSPPFWGRVALCVAIFSTSGVLRALAVWNAYRRRYEERAAAAPRR